MLSYHGDPTVKARHIALAKHHYEADMLLAGTYAAATEHGFKACSVGCMAHDIQADAPSDQLHAIVAADAGWPEWLVRLSDSMFEGLPDGERQPFHVQLREAVPIGVDLEPVRHLLAIRRMDRLIAMQAAQLGKHAKDVNSAIKQTIAAMQLVRRCHEDEAGLNVFAVDWSAARVAAMVAARAAWAMAVSETMAARPDRPARSAWLAARSAELSTRTAADLARSSASTAAESEGELAVKSATWEAAWIAERDALFAILQELTP